MLDRDFVASLRGKGLIKIAEPGKGCGGGADLIA